MTTTTMTTMRMMKRIFEFIASERASGLMLDSALRYLEFLVRGMHE